jgi:hypothetical protein
MTSNKALRDELLNCRAMFAALAMQVGEWRHAANEAILRIDGALSQPPRNCDRFANGDTASNTYEDEGGEKDYLDFARWLFAPAQKGSAR